MSSVHRNSQVPPSGGDDVGRSDKKEKENQKQSDCSGATEDGLSVEVLSSGAVSSVQPEVHDAILVEEAVGQWLDHGSPSALTPNSGAENVVQVALADFGKEDIDSVEKSLEGVSDLFEGVSEVRLLIEDYMRSAQNVLQTLMMNPGNVSGKKLRVSSEEERQSISALASMQRQIEGNCTSLKEHADLLLSSLTDLHKRMIGMSLEDFREKFGEDASRVERLLFQIGIQYTDSGWTILSRGRVPDLSIALSKLKDIMQQSDVTQLIEVSEGQQEEPVAASAKEEIQTTLTCGERLLRVWNTLTELFHRIYGSILFFLLWVGRKIGIISSKDDKKPKENLENPFASPRNSSSSNEENRSSLRSVISGRSDLSDEDQIRRPSDATIETQDAHGKQDIEEKNS
ncbi:hypothetical protein CP10139811_1010 [Chlamydia ibidis]|uniref:Uncharacterized protein n=2 Tax=Chlamydia ibidis TaxID=1405396 RepID=S7J4L7_9CHLA|nr:hypothetical protein [Chlamydia ibidis]EPP35349.1 hypothetical protein CP10139811_1010 [Chlamydia ibidis]EQM63057.1 hypothetical protein H359_0328 [Chlamydia ibidis 10-1398/6]